MSIPTNNPPNFEAQHQKELEKYQFGVKFRIGSDKKSGIISICEDWGRELMFKYINTKDRAIRDELIKLGWTPPEVEDPETGARP